jgi:hypothetical protein
MRNTTRLHSALKRTEVAYLYYLEIGRNYTPEAALRQWCQDTAIDKKALSRVLKAIAKESLKFS